MSILIVTLAQVKIILKVLVLFYVFNQNFHQLMLVIKYSFFLFFIL